MKIRVLCPFCGLKFETRTLKTVRCRRCNRSFEVYLLDSKGRVKGTRIIGLVDGSFEELYREAYKQKLRWGK